MHVQDADRRGPCFIDHDQLRDAFVVHQGEGLAGEGGGFDGDWIARHGVGGRFGRDAARDEAADVAIGDHTHQLPRADPS